MIYFDGIYRLRRNHTGLRSDPTWACAWRVRIIDLRLGHPQVTHLKPYIVFITPSDEGVFRASCAEHIGRYKDRGDAVGNGNTLRAAAGC